MHNSGKKIKFFLVGDQPIPYIIFVDVGTVGIVWPFVCWCWNGRYYENQLNN